MGVIVPVVITIYSDKSFEFIIKTPPATVLVKEAAKIQKGSQESNRKKVGSITWEQVKKIAETKMPDLNCFTLESAMKMIAGSARSIGITVSGTAPWEKK
jgi:large subunit ribosomal protein L11